ncbi:MAG: STAS domain-containing protein [Deltaproteobacteria bacterium]|nr:STAS domain-containing protein [Deltaproteobacteria bacterium]
MEFNTEIIDDVTVVELKTDVLDANNAREFKESISPVLENNQKVVFDMSQVGFLDSSGCGTILSCLRQLNSAGGDLKMYGLQKPVRTLFELIRMHRIIEIFNTKEEAVKSF